MSTRSNQFTGGNTNTIVRTALDLADRGVPVAPLVGKRPAPNCSDCRDNQCGGRPNMLAAGTCHCPRPCHGWAGTTVDADTITSAAWASAWRTADGIAWHPGGCGLTVVDLDDQAAVQWARATLPPTRIVPTNRGQHWIYLGHMRSANAVRPGVDVKSRMAYAVWRGPGTGHMTRLPGAVLDLAVREETTAPAPMASSAPWTSTTATGCRHTERHTRTCVDRGVQRILANPTQGAGTALYAAAAFLARQHESCPGPCGVDQLATELIQAAVQVGVPHRYAIRQATRGGLTAQGAAV